MHRQQIWMSITLIFFVVMSSIYANIVPRFEASDEAEHFIYMHVILETGELPRIQSRIDMANQTDPILRWNNQSHHAPLYYLLGSALISWTDRSDLATYLTPNELIFLRDTVEDNPNKWLHRYGEPIGQTHIALYILRAFNILIGVGTLIMVYLAATHTHKERVIAPLAMLFTALIPTFIIVNASVTNDALTIFLYSAGVYWLLRVWRREKITWRDTAIISLILAGISLTKLTGVTLFGVIYLGVFAGMLRKKWTWRTVLQVGIVSALAFVLLAGWWYLRNYNIYGDPLAQAATASIWGRMEGITLAEYGENLVRIAMSFWMMIGYLHQPVFLPQAFYWYCAVLTLAGIGGAIVYAYQATRDDRDIMFILAGVCIVVAALLLYGTLSVDISYGRLLLPAIAAFAPLIIIGLYNFINGWRIPLGIFVPLLISVIMTPFLVALSYSNIQAVFAVPESAQRIGWQNDNLEIVAVDTQPTDVGAGDTIYVDIYFRGNHPDNPALTVTAVDTIQVQRFDHIEIFPGMADMRHLPDDQLYRTTVLLDIPQPQTSRPPRVVNILIEWIDLETNTHLVFD
ncbi:MAG: phospholipid carrier-dependent glycosyltransferase, partial [Chloroflexota bacterium]